MSRRRPAATRRARIVGLVGAALGAVAILAVGWIAVGRDTAEPISPGRAQDQIAHAPGGAHLRLAPGTHRGPVVIERPLTLSAAPGAVLVAAADEPAVIVRNTRDVALLDLEVAGGSSGIEVRHSDDVDIRNAVVRGSKLHGIFAHDAEVTVTGCRVAGLRSPLAQGFEIINSDTRGPSLVDGCTVDGPVFEGISSHVSRVRFQDNRVTAATERAIVITEMSMGTAVRNVVSDSGGAAYFCGDMSRCTFLDNEANGVAALGDGFRSADGHGLVVHFHSVAEVKRLRTSDLDGQAVLAMIDSRLDRHASSGPPPLAPLLLVGGVAVGLLVAARIAGLRGVAAVLLPTFALQVGHQVEHAVQVGQILAGAEAAHGLAGAVVDTEWMHLAFNGVLLAGVWSAQRLARHRGAGSGRFGPPALVAALAVQGYHVVEHLVRVAQYLVTGISPSPGLAGALVGTGAGLAWFHFGVNLVVTVLLAAAVRAAPVRYAPTRLATSSRRSIGWTAASRT